MRALLFCLAVAACGGESAVNVDASIDAIDAAPPGPCWPVDTTTPGGSVELGTGYSSYRLMPDELPMVFGDQQGYHIEARARINGLDPGDPLEVTKPTNPRTRFSAFFLNDDGTDMTPPKPINQSVCPLRLGYVPASDGNGYTSPTYLEIRFEVGLSETEIFNKKFRVVVEVIDSAGKYAKAEKVITARAPTM